MAGDDVQEYVSPSSSGSEEPVPLSVTVVRSSTVWLAPASAVGALLISLTVTVTVSVSHNRPSVTLSVMV